MNAENYNTDARSIIEEFVQCAALGRPHGKLIAQAKDYLAARQPRADQHPDDVAVDAFAAAMKAKMADARAKGRGGWEDPAQCSAVDLTRLLRDHVEKGDPCDVANFCMMLHQSGESIIAYADLPEMIDQRDAAPGVK